jgi:hypothetical protein
MASLISENFYLIPERSRRAYAKQGLHLLVITDLEADNDIFVDPFKVALDEFKEDLNDKL